MLNSRSSPDDASPVRHADPPGGTGSLPTSRPLDARSVLPMQERRIV